MIDNLNLQFNIMMMCFKLMVRSWANSLCWLQRNRNAFQKQHECPASRTVIVLIILLLDVHTILVVTTLNSLSKRAGMTLELSWNLLVATRRVTTLSLSCQWKNHEWHHILDSSEYNLHILSYALATFTAKTQQEQLASCSCIVEISWILFKCHHLRPYQSSIHQKAQGACVGPYKINYKW